MTGICHISTSFLRRAGIARRTAAIVAACAERGYRVSLIAGRDHDLVDGDLPGVAIEIVRELAKPVRPLADATAVRRLGRLLRSLKPDLVHTHLAKAGILGRRAAARCGVRPIVHTVHGPTFPSHLPAPRRLLFRALERRAARLTDALVFVGEELR